MSEGKKTFDNLGEAFKYLDDEAAQCIENLKSFRFHVQELLSQMAEIIKREKDVGNP
jgi:hypothetical protein